MGLHITSEEFLALHKKKKGLIDEIQIWPKICILKTDSKGLETGFMYKVALKEVPRIHQGGCAKGLEKI